MESQTILDIIFNYGVGIACLIYLMYFQSTTMKDLIKTQQGVIKTLEEMNHRLDLIENKIDKKGD